MNILVRVKDSVDTVEIDAILKSIEDVARNSGKRVLMVLTGAEGSTVQGEKPLSFVQTESRVLQETTTEHTLKDDPTIPTIRYMLTPTLLTGLLVSGFILFIFIFAILQLMYVQTPTVFSNQSIDFGKIEKWGLSSDHLQSSFKPIFLKY